MFGSNPSKGFAFGDGSNSDNASSVNRIEDGPNSAVNNNLFNLQEFELDDGENLFAIDSRNMLQDSVKPDYAQ